MNATPSGDAAENAASASRSDRHAPRDLLAPIRDGLSLLALSLLPVFSLRAAVVANFDVSVATALVQNTSAAGLAVAIFIDSAPILSFAAAFAILYFFGRRWSSLKGAERYLAPIVAAVMVLGVSAPLILESSADPSIFVFMATYVLIGIIVFRGGMASTRGNVGGTGETAPESPATGTSLDESRLSLGALAISAILMLILVFRHTVWLPPEVLVTKTATQSVYIFQQADTDLIYFDPRAHAVLRMPKAQVVSRQFCDPGPMNTVSEYLLGRPTGRPPCGPM